MKKVFKIILKSVMIAVVVLLVLLGGIKVGEKAWFAGYYAGAEKAFKIPGLDNGFIPQGLTFDSESDKYLATGYSTSGASRVYSFSKKGSEDALLTLLKNSDGSDYDGHTGGICRNGEYVFITAGDGLDVFLYDEIMAGGEAKLVGTFLTGVDPAFCHIEGDTLYVGSFYFPEDYETPEHERIKTPAGDGNFGIIEAYALDDSGEYGVSQEAKLAYSIRGQAQGMCFAYNKLVLSTSYGLSTSQLFAYDYTKQATAGEYEIGGKTVPLYYLDSSNLISVTKAPPMAEEIVYIDGRIVIFNESASNKYIFGKFMSGYDAWSIEIK